MSHTCVLPAYFTLNVLCIHTKKQKRKQKPKQTNRATLPLTTDTKELSDCMCPHLSNLNGSEINAPNVVTDLSNISNQGHHEMDQMRFESLQITEITSTNNSNGETTPMTTINETTSTTPPDESRRHSSMDRIMSLLNDLGHSQRTRSLSDGGQGEGKKIQRKYFIFK